MKDELKITIDQLKNYLGTGLKIETWAMNPDYKIVKEVQEVYAILTYPDERVLTIRSKGNTGFRQISRFKPICYRMSDLNKFIPELGFVPFLELGNQARLLDLYDSSKLDFTRQPYDVLQKLFQMNFWVFGEEYFDQGLCIDKLNYLKEVSNG